jgi:hypothetical protein
MQMIGIAEYLNKGMSEIDGWFYALDSYLFVMVDRAQKIMGIKGDLCEVGVYQGKSLILLALLADVNEGIHGFDLFDPAIGSCEMAAAEQNLKRFLDDRRVALYRRNTQIESVESLRTTLRSPLRILHIDGGHEYAEVKHDLTTFSHFMLDGGVIILDDFNDREYPGVEAAVYEFSGPFNDSRTHVPFLIGANKIYLCCRDQVRAFQVQLLSHADRDLAFRLARVLDFRVLISQSKQGVPRKTILGSL